MPYNNTPFNHNNCAFEICIANLPDHGVLVSITEKKNRSRLQMRGFHSAEEEQQPTTASHGTTCTSAYSSRYAACRYRGRQLQSRKPDCKSRRCYYQFWSPIGTYQPRRYSYCWKSDLFSSADSCNHDHRKPYNSSKYCWRYGQRLKNTTQRFSSRRRRSRGAYPKPCCWQQSGRH